MLDDSQSPGYYATEIDESQGATTPNTSIGAIVGEFPQGPVNERTLITSEAQFVSVFGRPDFNYGYYAHSAIAFLAEADQLYVTRVAPSAVFGGCTISFDGKFNTSTPWTVGEADPTIHDFGASDLFIVYPIYPGLTGYYIRVYPDTMGSDPSYFYVDVYQTGRNTALESHRVNLQHIQDGYGKQRNVQEYINRNSDYVRVVQNVAASAFVATPTKSFINSLDAGGSSSVLGINLSGGSNGARATNSDLINAWDLYADPEYVSVSILLNAGNTNVDYQHKMIELAEERTDCFAILDVPDESKTASKAVDWRRNTLASDSTYAGCYTPWLLAADKYNDVRDYFPPSGFVGARFVATDRDYASYWAPAGKTRGKLPVDGAHQVYDKGMRDALYASQVNAIRVYNGEGIIVMGADTLQVVQSALSNISVRRLMILIEQSLASVLEYSVFDPNDTVLRSRLESQCKDVLQPIQDGRGLYYWHAQCDDNNNPASAIASGDLFVDIYVDPALPVKRIHFTAIVNRTGVTVTAQ